MKVLSNYDIEYKILPHRNY